MTDSPTTMLAEARALFEAAKRANDRESADSLSRQALALAIEVERQNGQPTELRPTVAELFSARDQIASDRCCDRREACSYSSTPMRDCACMHSAALRWHRDGDTP